MCCRKRSRVAGLSLLAACLLIATVALGATIEGKVKDQNGYGQPGVRVDFFGPTRRVVVTDSKGAFKVTLPSGVYQARVSSGMQRFESKQVVEENESQKLEITVDW